MVAGRAAIPALYTKHEGLGLEAIALTKPLQPDVVLLDLSLPDIDGLAVVERLHRAGLRPRILILSSHCDDYTLSRTRTS